MRYLGRVHGIAIRMLHEQLSTISDCKSNDIVVKMTNPTKMAADIHTKGFANAEKWLHAIKLICVFDPKLFSEVIRSH